MLTEIKLVTNDDKFVAVVDILPFQELPTVVIWGERVFTLWQQYGVRLPRYREAFSVVSLTPSPGRPMPEPTPPAPVDDTARSVVGAAIAPGVPDTTDRGDGQQRGYVVLSDDERAKGFVRPGRSSYVHVGAAGPRFPVRDLTTDEHERYDKYGYVKFEAYPEGLRGASTGRFWTQAQLDAVGKGCKSVTTMGRELAETYARKPDFYSGTFCASCGAHFPVGESGEFVWDGTTERVGT